MGIVIALIIGLILGAVGATIYHQDIVKTANAAKAKAEGDLQEANGKLQTALNNLAKKN
jgi:hypothetical protein